MTDSEALIKRITDEVIKPIVKKPEASPAPPTNPLLVDPHRPPIQPYFFDPSPDFRDPSRDFRDPLRDIGRGDLGKSRRICLALHS